MKRFVLVTGTDTGVGKTTISVALLGAWARRGWRVRPYKPVGQGGMQARQFSQIAKSTT